MTYKNLSQAERYQIHALMKAGHDQSQIAKLLDRHKSTISRELSRNTGSRGYRPKQACEISADRAQNSRNAPTVEPWVAKLPVLCCAFSGAPSKLPLSCPSAMKPFISMFMQTRRKAGRFGSTCAVRSKRGSAMQVAETGEDKSPTDGL